MTTDKMKISVTYLASNRLEFYALYLPAVLTYYFRPEEVFDLEVKNEGVFSFQIQSFIERNKLFPTTLIILLSESICFEKIFPEITSGHLDIETQKYIENIPFENVSSKFYKMEKGTRLIATNRDFYESVKNAFVKQGFLVTLVLPIAAVGEKYLGKGLTRELVEYVVEKMEMFKEDSFLVEELPKEGSLLTRERPLYQRRIFVLAVIFNLLLVILITMLFVSK